MAMISKKILDNANNAIRQQTNLTQWTNTYEVLQWFDNIGDKCKKTFIKFDIQAFYPNITKSILLDALSFAKKFISITDAEVETIIHSCKTILCYDNSIWVKKNNPTQFDIPMGSLHGAEACELVGLFLLEQMRTILEPENYGLYRDDGLIVHDISAQ